MLKKIYRITKDREYQAIYRRGRYQSTALFSVHYLPSKKGVSRVGIVVSKKITKKATERNHLKRQVREIMLDIHPRIVSPFDIVITAKASSLTSKYDALKKNLSESFTKAGLIK